MRSDEIRMRSGQGAAVKDRLQERPLELLRRVILPCAREAQRGGRRKSERLHAP